MKFSMIFEAQLVDTSRKAEQQVMRECVEQAVLAEQMGFDKVWAVEHHCLKWYAHMSAPETFLAYVAGRTERIRIGHGVVCLPFRMNHPVKVAERIAMLDILSNGRVEFGIGKGGTPQEAGAFQTEMDEIPAQLEESARMIPRMWREEVFEHRSPTLHIPPRPIVPKPMQDPHPPMYMACTREDTLNAAGERFWVKFHFKTLQGIRNLTNQEAARLIGDDRETHQRDLFDAIERGNFPRWRVMIQVMPETDAEQADREAELGLVLRPVDELHADGDVVHGLGEGHPCRLGAEGLIEPAGCPGRP